MQWETDCTHKHHINNNRIRKRDRLWGTAYQSPMSSQAQFMVQRGMPGSTPALPSSLIPELQAPCGLCDYPIQTEASRGEAWLLSLANHPPKPLRLILRPGSFPHILHSSFVLLCKPRQTQPHFPHHPSFFGDQEPESGRALEMYFWNCWGYVYLALCWLGSLPGTAKECLKKMHWR